MHFFSSVTLIRSTYWWYGIIVTCVFKIYVCRNSSKILMWNVLRLVHFFSALFLLSRFCAVSHLPTFVDIFQMSLVVKIVDILLFCFWGIWGTSPHALGILWRSTNGHCLITRYTSNHWVLLLRHMYWSSDGILLFEFRWTE